MTKYQLLVKIKEFPEEFDMNFLYEEFFLHDENVLKNLKIELQKGDKSEVIRDYDPELHLQRLQNR
ncbi:hypothetical protein OAQ99_04350 [Candidatus Kapabacteria bacterium]|nr:hypothetical protein [Candidatus Kapabacteria bacterium]